MAIHDVELTVVDAVDADSRQGVLDLADAASAADGVSPLDDQVRLDLAHGSTGARHVIALRGRDVVGYGHVRDGSGHVVVHPEHRHQGIGTSLVRALAAAMVETAGSDASAGPDATAESDASAGSGARLRIWSHGDLSAAQEFAGKLGLERVRELWQMAGALSNDLPQASYPDDVTVRTFLPGRDDEAWIAVNAAAFRDHPEQGRMTVEDLRQRMSEPWFDPAGFFVAERRDELLGYHWTKVHAARPGQDGRVGEVYVLGVAPAGQGSGLGTALTATGLRHLRDQGLDTVMLYVEGDNKPAIAVYEKLGLRQVGVDVMYRVPPG